MTVPVTLLVGIDISTRLLAAAVIPVWAEHDHVGATYREAALPDPDNWGQHLRACSQGAFDLSLDVRDHAGVVVGEIEFVAIERPNPRYHDNGRVRLAEIAGACAGSRWGTVATPCGLTAAQARSLLGIRQSRQKGALKAAAIARAHHEAEQRGWAAPPTEHHADALILALAERAIRHREHLRALRAAGL